MPCICICCGEPIKPYTGLRCSSCEEAGLRPDEEAYFTRHLDAIQYGEGRHDWPHFRVHHLKDHKYIVYNMGD